MWVEVLLSQQQQQHLASGDACGEEHLINMLGFSLWVLEYQCHLCKHVEETQ